MACRRWPYVKSGTVICEFETTKTQIEIEVNNDGYIILLADKSSDIYVGETIAIIVVDKQKIESVRKKFSKIEIFEKEDNKKYTFTKKAENLIKKHGLNKKMFKFEKIL